ncbi:unnamed protein product [Penicillium salamii]|nr:unnamed protein product [Penicillium salamii]
MSLTIQPRRITLVGATGSLGSQVLAALLAEEANHQVSVITRPGSTHVFDERVKIHRVDLDDIASLTHCLKSQDVLLMTLSPESYAKQVPLIHAAAAAHVPYVVPTEFGSNPTHPQLNRKIFLAEMQRPFRELIQELGVSSWIGVVSGLFFDFNVRNGFWGLDLRNQKVRLYDDGDVRISTSTLSWVGTCLARFFAMPDSFIQQYRNDWIFISSFLVSQREVWESAQRVTGTAEADFEVARIDAKEAAMVAEKGMKQGDQTAVFGLLFALTFQDGYGSDFQDRVLNYSAMGLTAPSLDDIVSGLAEEGA